MRCCRPPPHPLTVSPQTLRAAEALVKHINKPPGLQSEQPPKRDLLEEDADFAKDVPIWLTLTTKKHIIDKKRLKPGRIAIPHSFNAPSSAESQAPALRICLITADPQRTYKDLIAHPSFRAELRKSVTRVIGMSKLKAKYKSYESRRQLFGEHDIFLADDRVVTSLPKVLGKIFYHGGAKRPIPVAIAGKASKDKHGQVQKGSEKPSSTALPTQIASEMDRALNSALIHLSPSTNTSIKVGKSSQEPGQIAENIEAVVIGMVAKYIPQGWRNVRAIHIKGPNTMALPIWLADELWTEDKDIRSERPAVRPGDDKSRQKATEAGKPTQQKAEKKRKRSVLDVFQEEETTLPPKKSKSERKKEEQERQQSEAAERKRARRERLEVQKAQARKAGDLAVVGDVAEVSKAVAVP